jgi:hypothetical protein
MYELHDSLRQALVDAMQKPLMCIDA